MSQYVVFVDESGDHSLTSIDDKYPIFVLCFCVFKKNYYNNEVINKVESIKQDYFGDINVIFHESDIKRKRGAFAKLNKEQREAFYESINMFIDDADFLIISVVIDKPKHKEKYFDPIHPYHLAMQFGLERIYECLLIQGEIDKRLNIICEARGEKEDKELELAFRRVCDGHNRNNKRYNFEIEIVSKQTNSIGLQIADLIARPIGLSVLNPTQQNRAYEKIKKKFYSGRFGFIGGNGRKIFP